VVEILHDLPGRCAQVAPNTLSTVVGVWRRVRNATSPGWVFVHLLTVALVVTMVLLGRWQLNVSNSKHFNLQNFGYALQWWAFSAFVLVMWVRVVRDGGLHDPDAGVPVAENAEGAPGEPEAVQYRRYVMPSVADAAPSNDPTLGAYNDYLARLAADDERNRNTEGTAR
jgi:DNA-binding transcriptional regulator of glucitol operon